MNSFYPWLILLAPFASATIITLSTLRWKSLSSAISVTAVLVSFCCSCLIFAHSTSSAPEFVWLDVPPVFRVPLGLTLLAPILVNILLFHSFFEPSGIVFAIVLVGFWLVIFASVRSAFSGLFQTKA